MHRIKLFRDGEVNVFGEGDRIVMRKDVLVTDYDGSNVVFIEEGEEGFVCSLEPFVTIQFDDYLSGISKHLSLDDDLLLTDFAELLDGTHLRLVRPELESE
mgnify:FL=1|tara:strand:- start:4851 stop:5153 length:303 start_codon:yes stop_codon:yes gene_type:complete